jgi:plasmid maintenance system killer protein
MLNVSFKPKFIKKLSGLETDLQNEALDKIELLKDIKNHKILKVHKLHGKLSDQWSFSINYKFRGIFYYESKREIVLLTLGDHDIYK